MKRKKNDVFDFEIKEHIAVLRENKDGWSMELNVVAWNGNPEKYDIREWTKGHTAMSRGITLTHREAKILQERLGEHLKAIAKMTGECVE